MPRLKKRESEASSQKAVDWLSVDEEESNDEEDGSLVVNQKYAEQFESKSRTNELQRMKALGLDEDGDEYDSEDDESEDEDAEQLSATLDLQIVKTINLLKRKDPSIYENGKVWFEKPPSSDEDDDDDDDDDDGGGKDKKAKSSSNKKKSTYKDVLRQQLLKDGAGGDDDDDDDGDNDGGKGRAQPSKHSSLAYDKEQENLRQAFLRSARGSGAGDGIDGGSDSDDADDVVRIKQQSADDVARDEAALQEALREMAALTERQAGSEPPKKGASSLLSNSSSASFDPSTVTAEERERFLMEFMAKKKWKAPATRYSTREYGSGGGNSLDAVDLDDDEEEVDRMEEFESKYNFRFEEAAAEASASGVQGSLGQVQGHSRNQAALGSVRREDDKRKLQRQAREEAKARERRVKEEELKRLKNLKRRELEDRVRKIARVGGLDLGAFGSGEEEGGYGAEDAGGGGASGHTSKRAAKAAKRGGKKQAKAMALPLAALEDDWDPEAHERLMAAQFDDDYYEQEDDEFAHSYKDKERGGEGEGEDPDLESELAGYGYEDADEGEGEGGDEGWVGNAGAGSAIVAVGGGAEMGKKARKAAERALREAKEQMEVREVVVFGRCCRALVLWLFFLGFFLLSFHPHPSPLTPHPSPLTPHPSHWT